jgi:DNA-binding CsgD family transcriptional regulator
MIVRYVSWSHGSYLSLRAGEKEIRESLEAVFSGHRAIPESLWDSVDEYFRLADFEPYLTCREIEIVRCIAEGRTAGETAEALTVSEHTITNHLCNVYRKFGTRSRVVQYRRMAGMEFIAGRSRNQTVLLPDSIEEYVEGDNAARVIEAHINGLDLSGPEFSRLRPRTAGRPGRDPKDLSRLYVYGYMNRVRSSRRLEAKRNVEVMRLLGRLFPNHKTIALFRRGNTAVLRKAIRNFVGLCVKLRFVRERSGGDRRE